MAVPSPTPASRKTGLTRSPAGNYLSSAVNNNNINGDSTSPLRDQGQGQGDYMIRSSSAISSTSSINPNLSSYSSSPNTSSHPGLGRRRSTDASAGGLDYYFSSLSGIGGSGPLSSSSSSSLGIFPSSSPNSTNINNRTTLNPPSTNGISPVGSFERDSKNVGYLRNEEFISPHGMGLSFSPSSMSSTDDRISRGIREAKSLGNLNLRAQSQTHRQTQTMDSPKDEKTPTQPSYPDPTPNPALPSKALNITYPPNDVSMSGIRTNDLSPGGWSETSKYSNTDDGAQSTSASPSYLSVRPPWKKAGEDGGSGQGQASGDESSESNYSPVGFKIPGKFDFEDDPPQDTNDTLDNQQPQQQNVWDIRSSVQSTSTYRPNTSHTGIGVEEYISHRTPIAPMNNNDRPDIRPPPQLSLNQSFHTSSPSGSVAGTPKRSPNSRSVGGSSHHTPTSSTTRLGLGFDINQFTRNASPSGPSSFHSHGLDYDSTVPRSAPANRSEFGLNQEEGRELLWEDEDDEDLSTKQNRRSTLPVTTSTSTSSGVIVESMLPSPSRSKENLLSPEKYTGTRQDGTFTPTLSERRGSTPSPNRSPEPPPRSALRQLPNATNIDVLGQLPNPPPRRTSSPQSITQTLPLITHTPNSPMPSPDRPTNSSVSVNLDKPQPKRPDRSPDRQHSPVFPSSATINDLTDMLGGAIDAIGLIDSRDTPPPTIGEPDKFDKDKKKNLTLRLEPAAEVSNDRGPMTPTSLPQRGTSLPGQSIPPSVPQQQSQSQPIQSNTAVANGRRSTQPELKQKASSIFSFASTSKENIHVQSPTLTISVRPWPSAMLYGNIKSLKHSGDRAKGYAKAINELSRSESGLREWCIASANQVNRAPTKSSALSSLGVRANSVPSAIPLPYQLSPYDPTPHQRNVSAGSEFPMRADSYAAREISQRVLDPEDQPTSLPANLPYPQLQQQQHYLSSTSGGGLKPSQSMQSVASFASGKKGFFSAISKKGYKKESLSLGPPTGQINNIGGGGGGSSVNKKDIRGLPISGPRSNSPQKLPLTPSSDSGLTAPRVQNSISAPMGPRGPRGTCTPPPSGSGSGSSSGLMDAPAAGRSSLDTGLARMNYGQSQSGRNSLDGAAAIAGAGYIPPPRSSLAGGSIAVKEEDLRQMSDILPHVERNVLRGYLARYGESMTAIGAYLEDDKNGTVMRM
ncbi:hypothetical protein I203_101156 [Kwoniella mangroviensis CBS 8507]|uniref:uncharacterized protein n=1 Tax=Kwoniella mangroviensis CBS 8507 TaxID=1296122 RepID=UPI00080D13F5|nr:uncharacterized protein I203_02790 [Kwoniella mangroviensis CBS 8507]OCF68129.1 hypothetical protein I203_02790 [Kwoniella mangroviensis CBS 8507]